MPGARSREAVPIRDKYHDLGLALKATWPILTFGFCSPPENPWVKKSVDLLGRWAIKNGSVASALVR